MDTTIPTIPARQLITRHKSGGWFGCTYNMNIYRGCPHGCIYCDSRSDCYRLTPRAHGPLGTPGDSIGQGAAPPLTREHAGEFDRVYAKQDALAILRADLARLRRVGVIATGAMSDPYNPHEKDLRLTRQALGLIGEAGFGVAIDTKSDLVARDIDLLRDIGRQAPALVKLTITAADDAMAARIEPGAPSTSARLEALRALREAGVYTGVLMTPLLPYITDTEDNVLAIVQKAAAAGARFVYPGFGLTQRAGQREYFHAALDRLWPGMAARYQARFGADYMCPSPEADRLHRLFAQACTRLGLLYRMADIVADYQQWPHAQTSLF